MRILNYLVAASAAAAVAACGDVRDDDYDTTYDSDTYDADEIADNDDPDVTDDEWHTRLGRSVTIRVLSNDRDPDGDRLSILRVDAADDGVAVLNDDGTITYTPNAGFDGEDSFDYVVSDGRGGEATATVSVEVLTDEEIRERRADGGDDLLGIDFDDDTWMDDDSMDHDSMDHDSMDDDPFDQDR